MPALAAGVIAVLLLVWLLAAETFGVAIVALAYLGSRAPVTLPALARAGAAMAVSAAAFVGIAVLLGWLIPG